MNRRFFPEGNLVGLVVGLFFVFPWFAVAEDVAFGKGVLMWLYAAVPSSVGALAALAAARRANRRVTYGRLWLGSVIGVLVVLLVALPLCYIAPVPTLVSFVGQTFGIGILNSIGMAGIVDAFVAGKAFRDALEVG